MPNARVAKNNPEWYWGIGLTAEPSPRNSTFRRPRRLRSGKPCPGGGRHRQRSLRARHCPHHGERSLPGQQRKAQERQHVIDTDKASVAAPTPRRLPNCVPSLPRWLGHGRQQFADLGRRCVCHGGQRANAERTRRRTHRAIEIYHVAASNRASWGSAPSMRCLRLKKAGLTKADIAGTN